MRHHSKMKRNQYTREIEKTVVIWCYVIAVWGHHVGIVHFDWSQIFRSFLPQNQHGFHRQNCGHISWLSNKDKVNLLCSMLFRLLLCSHTRCVLRTMPHPTELTSCIFRQVQSICLFSFWCSTPASPNNNRKNHVDHVYFHTYGCSIYRILLSIGKMFIKE